MRQAFARKLLERLKPIYTKNRNWNNHPERTAFLKQGIGSFHYHGIKVAAFFCFETTNLIVLNIGVFHIRRVANNDIKAATPNDDVIKFGIPMEGLVGGFPFRERFSPHGVGNRSQCNVEQIIEGVEFLAEGFFAVLEIGGIAVAELEGAETGENVGNVFGLLFDFLVIVFVDGQAVGRDDGVVDGDGRGVADEGIAATDVEVDVGERVEAEVVVGAGEVGVDDGDHLEEEAELGDFDGLGHDVDAVEVAEDDALVDEMPAVAAEGVAEFGEFFPEEARIVGVEFLHAVEAAFVERLEDVHGGEEEGAGTAGGVEDGDGAEGFVDVADEEVVGGLGDEVFGEGAHVEVEAHEVADVVDGAGGDFVADFGATAAAVDGFAPDFGGEGEGRIRGFVPAGAAGVQTGGGGVDAAFDIVGERVVDALEHGGEDEAVAALGQGAPDVAAGLEGGGVLRCDGVEQPGDDAIPADVVGDVFLGVVGTHLGAVVEVLLEDVAEDVGVDVAFVAGGSVVEVPVPLVEEGEEFLEHAVREVDAGVGAFDGVEVEETAVEVGNPTEGANEGGGAAHDGSVEAVGEQGAEEALVEGAVEAVFAPEAAGFRQLAGEVVWVLVEEAFLLHEVAEHEAVEHDGGVALAVGGGVEPLQGLREGLVVFAEKGVEALGDPLGVGEEGLFEAVDGLDGARRRTHGKTEAFELFAQEGRGRGVRGFVGHEPAAVHGADGNHPELAAGRGGIDEDGKVGVAAAAQFRVQGGAFGGTGKGRSPADPDTRPELGGLAELERLPLPSRRGRRQGHGERPGAGGSVPTQFQEKGRKIGLGEGFVQEVGGHGFVGSCQTRSREASGRAVAEEVSASSRPAGTQRRSSACRVRARSMMSSAVSPRANIRASSVRALSRRGRE